MMGPPRSDALIKNFRIHANFQSPVESAHTASAMLKNHIPTIVARLFFARSPSAIFLGVWAVIILSINGFPFSKFWTHVLNKVEWVMPSVANDNSAPAVSAIAFIIFVIASAMHCFPYLVQRIGPQSVLRDSFLLKAPATFAGAGFELIKSHIAWLASAPTLAHGKAPALVTDDGIDGPESKGLAY